jgi:hypothetical protein
MLRRPLFAAVAAALLLTSGLRAQDVDRGSANYMLKHCKAALGSDMASVDPFAVTCFATINTYAYIGTSLNAESKFCAPKGVTVQQMIRVAVKYMEDRPAQLHHPFRALSLVALHEPWPCPK